MSEVMYFLGIIPLTPDQFIFLHTILIPAYAFISSLVFTLFILFMPRSAKKRIGAWFKRSGVLVTTFSDDGFEGTEIMKADLGQGIFAGNPISYLFTPRPATVKKDDKNLYDLIEKDDDIKDTIDEAILHRCFSDTGKAIYLCYVGKLLAVTPRFLKHIKTLDKKLKDPEVREAELLDPRILKLYMPKTLSRAAIESIKFEHERIGFNRKPVMDAVKKFILPVGLILIIIVAAYLFLSGDINFGEILG